MKIYTKTGDKGTTSLIGGLRIQKNDIRLIAYGSVDELNSFLGLLRSKVSDSLIHEQILHIQNLLFNIGAHLATDRTVTELGSWGMIKEEDILYLESLIDAMDSELPRLNNFVIYGDSEISALCHVCRAVCRRSERDILTVSEYYAVDLDVLSFMNRLSDYLFVLSRYVNKNDEKDDFFWKK